MDRDWNMQELAANGTSKGPFEFAERPMKCVLRIKRTRYPRVFVVDILQIHRLHREGKCECAKSNENDKGTIMFAITAPVASCRVLKCCNGGWSYRTLLG